MADVVEHADVGVVQAGNRFRFALEALLRCRVARNIRRQNLDGHGAIQPGIFRAIYLAHTARAKRREYLVRT